jgi:hypothetical protein
VGQIVGASVSENLGFWFESLNKMLPERTIHHLLWQLKPEIDERPDANATKLIDDFQAFELEAGTYDPRMQPPARFKVKFLGTESRIATILTGRLIIFFNTGQQEKAIAMLGRFKAVSEYVVPLDTK